MTSRLFVVHLAVFEPDVMGRLSEHRSKHVPPLFIAVPKGKERQPSPPSAASPLDAHAREMNEDWLRNQSSPHASIAAETERATRLSTYTLALRRRKRRREREATSGRMPVHVVSLTSRARSLDVMGCTWMDQIAPPIGLPRDHMMFTDDDLTCESDFMSNDTLTPEKTSTKIRSKSASVHRSAQTSSRRDKSGAQAGDDMERYFDENREQFDSHFGVSRDKADDSGAHQPDSGYSTLEDKEKAETVMTSSEQEETLLDSSTSTLTKATSSDSVVTSTRLSPLPVSPPPPGVASGATQRKSAHQRSMSDYGVRGPSPTAPPPPPRLSSSFVAESGIMLCCLFAFIPDVLPIFNDY